MGNLNFRLTAEPCSSKTGIMLGASRTDLGQPGRAVLDKGRNGNPQASGVSHSFVSLSEWSRPGPEAMEQLCISRALHLFLGWEVCKSMGISKRSGHLSLPQQPPPPPLVFVTINIVIISLSINIATTTTTTPPPPPPAPAAAAEG